MPAPRASALRLISYFRGSSSLPGLVSASNDKTYVVKWHGSGDGLTGSITEWVSLQLARAAGVSVPDVSLIEVNEDLAGQTIDSDLADVVRRSPGLNLGVEYLPGSRNVSLAQVDAFDEEVRRTMFLFDVLFMNIDRTRKNLNLMLMDGRPVGIDYATVLEVRTALEGRKFEERSFGQQLRSHPFYERGGASTLLQLGRMKTVMGEIVASIPDEWLGVDAPSRIRLGQSLEKLLTGAERTLRRRLTYLSSVKLESDDEYESRTRANREAFEASVASWQEKSKTSHD